MGEDFQFSFWDSPCNLKNRPPPTTTNFQFSFWDSMRREAGGWGRMPISFNSLFEILCKSGLMKCCSRLGLFQFSFWDSLCSFAGGGVMEYYAFNSLFEIPNHASWNPSEPYQGSPFNSLFEILDWWSAWVMFLRLSFNSLFEIRYYCGWADMKLITPKLSILFLRFERKLERQRQKAIQSFQFSFWDSPYLS